jgi:uncharacterized protein Veg
MATVEVEEDMRGIHCALEGHLGQDVELRPSESGKDWARRRHVNKAGEAYTEKPVGHRGGRTP